MIGLLQSLGLQIFEEVPINPTAVIPLAGPSVGPVSSSSLPSKGHRKGDCLISPELDDKKILTRRQQERVLGSFLLASIVDVYSLGEMSNYDSGIARRGLPLAFGSD